MTWEFSFRPEPFPWLTELEWEGEASRTAPDYIRWLQSSLNRVMGLRLAVDGIMGPATRSAIRSFRQRKGLAVDGIAGPDTESALIAASAPKPPVAVSASAAGSPSSTALPPECSAAGSGNCDVLDDFALGDDTLTAIHREQIAGIARRVISSQETSTPITSLTIVGHASPEGTYDYNIKLALRRATKVKLALLDCMEFIEPGSSSPNRIKPDVKSCGEEKIPDVSNFAERRRVDVCFLERVLWGSARSRIALMDLLSQDCSMGLKQQPNNLREERINDLIEAAMASDSRTAPVRGGPNMAHDVADALLVFPKLSIQTKQALGAPLSKSFERQLAYLLTPRAEFFARSLGRQDTSHFHIAVPSELKHLLKGPENDLKSAMAAAKTEEQVDLAYNNNVEDLHPEPGHPEIVVALMEAQVATGQPLEKALRKFFEGISAIRGVSIVFHTLEGYNSLRHDPRRFHLFPLDSPVEKKSTWRLDPSGSVHATPDGYAMGVHFHFWPAGTVEATAPGKNQEIVVSPAFQAFLSAPGMPF